VAMRGFFEFATCVLFTLLTDQLLGFGEKVRLSSGARVEMMEPARGPPLMLIYGGGFAAVRLVFVSLYLRDLSLRGALRLGSYELSVTMEEIQDFLLNASVALTSVAVAVFGEPRVVSWVGVVHLLIFPLQTINGRTMMGRRRMLGVTAGSTDEEGETREDPNRMGP
jgi:hypothetical protein